MTAEENLQKFRDRINEVLPDGCRIIGKIKQHQCHFIVDISIPFGLTRAETGKIEHDVYNIWANEIKAGPLPSYEQKTWDSWLREYKTEVVKLDGRYTQLTTNLKVQKGDVKITWENFEEVVTANNDEANGKFFFPKSNSRYNDAFAKSIAVGYILPDGTHTIYVVAAPSGLLTKLSHLLSQGSKAIEVIETLANTAVSWKE